MHIRLKRARGELIRYLPKGSDEQIIDLFEIVRDHYYSLPEGEKEKNKIETLENEISRLKQEIDDLKGGSKRGRPRKED